MADHTHIEWTDATWNPITGCSVVSAGCKHCYAMKLAGTRMRNHPSRAGLVIDTAAGPVWNGHVRLNEEWLDQPLRWRRPRRIFVCAHGDLFHESVPDEWIDRVFAIMALAQQHTFQVLTKRAQRMLDYFNDPAMPDRVLHLMCDLDPEMKLGSTRYWPLPNVWLGVSVENQCAADERIPLLLQTPAAVRWISAEPLLGPVDLNGVPPPAGTRPVNGASMADISGCLPRWQEYPMRAKLRDGIDWVVTGGESGPNARPMHPDWVRSLRDQCAAACVPFLYKQHGEWLATAFCDDAMAMLPSRRTVYVKPDGSFVELNDAVDFFGGAEETAWVGKKAAGRMLDGVLHDAYPEPRHG